MAALGPAFALQFPVTRADGIGVQFKATGELAGAGQAVSRAQVAGHDGQHDLGDELAIDRDLARMGEPEAHAEVRPLLHLLPAGDWKKSVAECA